MKGEVATFKERSGQSGIKIIDVYLEGNDKSKLKVTLFDDLIVLRQLKNREPLKQRWLTVVSGQVNEYASIKHVAAVQSTCVMYEN